MKFIIALIVALVVMPAHAINGHFGSSTNLDYAKAVVPESVEKLFINVKANGAIAAGAVASWDLTADNGATVVIAPTTGLAPACVMVVACADGALCSCQIYGVYETALFDSTAASSVAGNKVVSATGNAGYIAARATALATEPSLGYFFDSASASASVQMFINIR